MKMLLFIIIHIAMLGTSFAAKEDGKESIKETNPEAKNESDTKDKRLYTEEEFQKSVLAEVEKHLNKVGSSKIIEFSKELIRKEHDIKLTELKITKSAE